MGRERTISVVAEVRIPRVPNYLLFGDPLDKESGKIDVADVTDASLHEIGRIWTEELIANAAKRRSGGTDG